MSLSNIDSTKQRVSRVEVWSEGNEVTETVWGER